MDAPLSRSGLVTLGLVAVAAIVIVAAVTVETPERFDSPDLLDSPDHAWNPCQDVFDSDAAQDRLAWFFDDPQVPGALVAQASGQLQHCSSLWTQNENAEVLDRRLAVGYVFFEGDGENRREAVWWLFVQDEADVPTWDAELVSMSANAELEFFDGYIVAFSKNASEAIRTAARSAPDRDAATLQIDGRTAGWGFSTVTTR